MHWLHQDYASESEETSVNSSNSCSSNSSSSIRHENPAVIRILHSFPESSEEKKELGLHRCVPHTEGNWSGHIYLPLCIAAETDQQQGWEDALNRTSFAALLQSASRAVHNFADAQTRVVESSSHSSIALIPHFNYPHVEHLDSSDDDDKSLEEGSSIQPMQSPIPRIHAKKQKRMQQQNMNQHRQQFICNLHVSLSKPFYLQQHNIQSFVADLTQSIQAWQQLQQGPLILSFATNYNKPESSYSILFNEDRTRAFLTLTALETCTPHVIHLIRRVVDPIMTKYGLDTYRFDGKRRKTQDSDADADADLSMDHGQVKIHVTIASMVGSQIATLANKSWEADGTTPMTTTATTDNRLHETCSPTKVVEQVQTHSFIIRHVVFELGGNYHTWILPLYKESSL